MRIATNKRKKFLATREKKPLLNLLMKGLAVVALAGALLCSIVDVALGFLPAHRYDQQLSRAGINSRGVLWAKRKLFTQPSKLARSKSPSKVMENEEDEEPVFVPLDTLQGTWKKMGKSIDTFDEKQALLAYLTEEEGDDDDFFAGFGVQQKGEEFLLADQDQDVQQQQRKKAKPTTKTSNSATSAAAAEAAVAVAAASSEIPPGRSVGIDLGTTYSSVALIEAGKPVIVPVDGLRIVPSVVGYLQDGTVIVGEMARRQLVINPQNTFASVKRVIGRTLGQVRTNGDRLPVLKVDPSSSATSLASLKCPKVGRNLAPEEVSAEVLRQLLKRASEYLGGEVISKAVITVPAYFLAEQCAATEKAGMLAGLKKVKLLREPEAAALAYGLSQEEQKIVLVFDLGGGTFDVSVLEVGGGFVEVIATSGDAHLGGDDFDELIVGWMVEQIAVLDVGISKAVRSDPVATSRMYEAAEDAKVRLSTAAAVEISLPMLRGGFSLTCTLTRKRFETMSKKLIVRLLKPLREVAIMAGVNLPGESGQLGVMEGTFGEDDLFEQEDEEEAEDEEEEEVQADNESEATGSTRYTKDPLAGLEGLSKTALRKAQQQGRKEARERKKVKGSTSRELRRLQKENSDEALAIFPGGQALSDVILVGGATRIPAVQALVRTITGIDPKRSVNPDEAVSLGAAVLAGILDGDIKDMNVMSAWQASMYRAFYEQQLKDEAKKVKNEASSETNKKKELDSLPVTKAPVFASRKAAVFAANKYFAKGSGNSMKVEEEEEKTDKKNRLRSLIQTSKRKVK